MKKIVCVSIILLLIGCQKDNTVNDNGSSEKFTPTSGNGFVEGYVGYFEPIHTPDGRDILPSGYALTSFFWKTDSPKVSYSMVYLTGKENELKNTIYVKVFGEWQTKISVIKQVYVEMKVDSLQVIQ